jgi:hypothetical protein
MHVHFHAPRMPSACHQEYNIKEREYLTHVKTVDTHMIIFPCIFRYYSTYSKNSALAQLTVEVEKPIQGLFISEKALLT